MQDHKETIVTCVITLGSTILSEVFPNLATKLVFIVLSIVAVVAFFKGDEKDKRGIQRFSFFLAAVLVVFIVVYGIFPGFPSNLISWGKQAIQDQDNEVIALTSKKIYQKSLNDVNQSMGKLQDDIGQASAALTELNGFLESEIFSYNSDKETYSSEIEELLEGLADKAGEIDKDFPNIALDAETVELFYKTQLYDKVYHYSSFICAFEEYGIHCNSLDIDEYTLALWDVENLYIFYNMQKELEPDLIENRQYEEREFFFNSNRVDLNQYSDFLNYGNQSIICEGKNDAQQLEEIFRDYIMNFYKRFHLNFTR